MGKRETCLELLWYDHSGKWQKSQYFGIQRITDNHSEDQVFLQRKQVKDNNKSIRMEKYNKLMNTQRVFSTCYLK